MASQSAGHADAITSTTSAEHTSTPTESKPNDSEQTNIETEESTNPMRKCGNCHTPASEENKLKYCSKCRAIMYCSRDCQVAHWKKHKPICLLNNAQAAQLTTMDLLSTSSTTTITNNSSGPSQTPTSMSWRELDSHLEKWVQHHSPTLMLSTIHALKLPLEFPRARTHLLRLSVSFNPEHGGNVGKFFKLDEVEVKELDEARMLDSAWNVSVDQLRRMREDSERQRRGTVVAAAIECKPLAVQVVPFGSIKEPAVKNMKWVEGWEENLRRCIETGSKNFEL